MTHRPQRFLFLIGVRIKRLSSHSTKYNLKESFSCPPLKLFLVPYLPLNQTFWASYLPSTLAFFFFFLLYMPLLSTLGPYDRIWFMWKVKTTLELLHYLSILSALSLRLEAYCPPINSLWLYGTTAVVRRGSAPSWQRGSSVSASGSDVAWLVGRRGWLGGSNVWAEGWHSETGTWMEGRCCDLGREAQAKDNDCIHVLLR